jgi:hypothetical protein
MNLHVDATILPDNAAFLLTVPWLVNLQVDAKQAVPPVSRNTMDGSGRGGGKGGRDGGLSNIPVSTTKIFVGGLHYDTNDGELRRYFEAYGKVMEAEVMLNKNPRNQMLNKSRGFGFVTFEDASSVELVLHAAQTQQHYIDGKLVRVQVSHFLWLMISRGPIFFPFRLMSSVPYPELIPRATSPTGAAQ